MAGEIGINLRQTSGYVTDAAGFAYCLGDVYPTTRAIAGGPVDGVSNLTFGWSAAPGLANRSTSYGPRPAGINHRSNASATLTFTWDLTKGPGTYTFRLCAGDTSSAQGTRLVIRDGAGGTVLATIDNTTVAGNFLDAAGTSHAVASWAANNVSIPLTFANSAMVITVGGQATTGAASVLSSMSLDFVGGGADVSGGVTIDNVVAAGSLGSSDSDLSGGVTLDAVLAAGILGQQPGICVVPALKNWNGSLATSELVPWVTFCRLTDAVQVLILANQTTHASTADLSFTNAALLVGTWYMVIGWNADGSRRFALPVQAT